MCVYIYIYIYIYTHRPHLRPPEEQLLQLRGQALPVPGCRRYPGLGDEPRRDGSGHRRDDREHRPLHEAVGRQHSFIYMFIQFIQYYMYMYIYLSISLSLSVCVYIYIYTYTQILTSIDSREAGLGAHRAGDPRHAGLLQESEGGINTL